MNEKRNSLSRVLGRTDVLALGFGTIVGWTWVALATTWLTEAGFLGAITAFAAASVIIFGVGLLYGELTSALPLAGGELVYAYRATGFKGGWAVGWTLAFAYIGAASWQSIALATAGNAILPMENSMPVWEIQGNTVYLSWALIGMTGSAIVMLLNLFGIRPAIIFQVMITAGIFVVVLIVFFGGLTFGDTGNITNHFTSGDGFIYVFLMVPSMMMGFDVIPQAAEEMNIPPKEIGRAILTCMVVGSLFYILIMVGLALSAPIEVQVSGTVPAADTVSYAFGDSRFGTVVIIGGIFGVLTSWNGFFMGATRLIFAMARAGMLPNIFGWIHPKYKTPWGAIFLVGGICILAPLLGSGALIWFVDSSAFCVVFSYCSVAVSFVILRRREFVILRRREPSLDRPLKIRHGEKIGAAMILLTASYFMVYILEMIDNEHIAEDGILICGWLILGIGFYAKAKRERRYSEREMEVMVFGEKYARKI